MSLVLSGIRSAVLTGGTNSNTFSVGTWTGNGTLTGGGGSDTVTATKDANFTLADGSLTSGDGMTLTLNGITTANLAGGPGGNSLDGTGWTGGGPLSGGRGHHTG